MQKITPLICFDQQAKEAIDFYCQLFVNSKITNKIILQNPQSGNTEVYYFQLAGQDFMAMNSKHSNKLTSAISLFVVFETEEETEEIWNQLVRNGQVLMPFAEYPFANKYGWVQDKYGLSWQLIWSEHHELVDKITPALLFSGPIAGWAKEAIGDYTRIFPRSKMELAIPYTKDDNDVEGFLKHARFTLSGEHFIAIDSSQAHDFAFTDAISFIINCDNQQEVDYFFAALSAVPKAEQAGWLEDKYGVSWQVWPREINEMLASDDLARVKQMTEVLFQMKKIDLAALKAAYLK